MSKSNEPISVIVAGTRWMDDYKLVERTLDFYTKHLTVKPIIVCGLAEGPDKHGERYGKNRSLLVKYFPADWDKYGKSAGYIRNAEMAKVGTHLLAFWDGVSKGTKHMIDLALKKGLVVKIIRVERRGKRWIIVK